MAELEILQRRRKRRRGTNIEEESMCGAARNKNIELLTQGYDTPPVSFVARGKIKFSEYENE